MSPTAVARLRAVPSLLLVAGLATVLWPVGLGGRASVVIVSGISMEPALHTGDLVLLREEPAYEPGDVVAFRVPEGEQGAGATVIHRVVRGNGRDGYELRGDNKERSDPWRPTASDVIGSRQVLVPHGGTVITWLRVPLRLAALAAALTVFVVVARRPDLPPNQQLVTTRPVD
jgi:signal peptidase I